MQVFDAYATYYDLLYRDKGYGAEVKYIAGLLNKYGVSEGARLLELGCGTGAHAAHFLENGFCITGIDQSEGMIQLANERIAALGFELGSYSFQKGNVQTWRENYKYSAVLSLFHVMSYQTTNKEVDAAFETAAQHLDAGGIFLFDAWYGPAVLFERPDVRVKRLEVDNVRVVRIAEPNLLPNENIVEVNYEISVEAKEINQTRIINEVHRMRYFFLPEIVLLADKHGFILEMAEELVTSRVPSSNTWSLCFVLKKVE